MTALSILLFLYLGSLLFLRWRNAVHLPLGRQLTDFSVFMVPFNIPAYLLSKLPLKPWLRTDAVPDLKILEDNWETIRDEALALYSDGKITAKNDLPASSFYREGRWTSFYLKVYDNDLPSARNLAPKTCALIEQVPHMDLALFAVLMPGKELGAHHDPFAFSLRYSLGLSTPNNEGCGLMVNGEHYTWKDGEGVLFDETYLHAAYNRCDQPRIILMTDVQRPLRLRLVQWIYALFGRFFNSLFYIDNLDPTKSGIGNRLSGVVTSYKETMKGLKQRNRRAYKTGKWALHLGLVALIISALLD